MKINGSVPEGGINESKYVEINGTKQWISIYGENKKNPVLLYLHGGPGSSTSAFDYAFTRKWADVYTVVTWDQRNCGKSYDSSQNKIQLTYDLMMSDGVEMTKYLLKYLEKDKITLLGHSWGTYLGANLAMKLQSCVKKATCGGDFFSTSQTALDIDRDICWGHFCRWLNHIKTLFTLKKCCDHKAFCKQKRKGYI